MACIAPINWSKYTTLNPEGHKISSLFNEIYIWQILYGKNYLFDSANLKSWLVWISDGQKEVGLQMFWTYYGIWDPEAQLFEVQTNRRHFVKNHLKSWQKYPDFEWSGFKMVGTKAIAKA